MSANYSFDDIWRAFIEVEAHERLVEFRIGNIYLWPLLRDRLIRDVAETLGVYEKRSEPDDVAGLAGEKSILASFQASTVAIVPFLRRDANGHDQFSQFIVNALRGQGIEPLVFGMGKDDIGSGRPQIEVLERYYLRKYRTLAKFAVAPTIRAAHRERYSRALEALSLKITGDAKATITSKYQNFPRWLLVDFYAQRLGFKQFFKSAKVQTLVLVNAWKRGLIAGAQAAGVWVIEPQHGLLSDKLPLLSWPNSDYVAYLPNELMLWGEYWGEVADLPLSINRTVIGAPEKLAELVEQNIPHKAGTVLIVSQVQQTTKILDLAIRAALANPELKFVLKPHPQEQKLTLGDIQSRVAQVPENLQFASPDAPALPMIARAEYVVGVHSMAMIEALVLGAKVLALNLPGVENVRSFIPRGDITLADANGTLTKELALSRVAENAARYFAPRISAEQLTKLIEGENHG